MLIELPIGMSLWPPKFNLITTYVTTFFKKEKLEVTKGLDHFDLSFEPIGLPSPSQYLQTI